MSGLQIGFGLFKNVSGNVTPSEVVIFDTIDPNIGGTTFDPDIPEQTDVLYVSSIDASTWIWDGASYITYIAPTTATTEWNLYGTNIDAGGNKTAFIQRNGPILINSASANGSRYAGYFYSRRTSGQGNGLLIRKDSRTTSGNYLLVQGYNFSTNVATDKFKVGHDGKATINGAYALPNVDGTAGQGLVTDGSGVVSWGNSGATNIRRHQTTANYDYLGYAVEGTLESDPDWNLTRLTLDSSGVSAVMTATDSWNNRVTATYI